MSRILKNDRGEEIARMVDAQWILRIFEAAHIDAQADRVQVTHCVDPWLCDNGMAEEQNDQKIPRYENEWKNDSNR
jgi:hypothetical protein